MFLVAVKSPHLHLHNALLHNARGMRERWSRKEWRQGYETWKDVFLMLYVYKRKWCFPLFSKILHIFCLKSKDIPFDIKIAVKASASCSSSEAAPWKRERSPENGEDGRRLSSFSERNFQNSVFVFSRPFRSFAGFAGMLDYNLGRTKYPLDLDVVGTCFENVLNGRHQR